MAKVECEEGNNHEAVGVHICVHKVCAAVVRLGSLGLNKIIFTA